MRYEFLPELPLNQHFTKSCPLTQTPILAVHSSEPPKAQSLGSSKTPCWGVAQPPPLNRIHHTAVVFTATSGEPQAFVVKGPTSFREKRVYICSFSSTCFHLSSSILLLLLIGSLNQISLGENNSSTSYK